MFFVFLLDDTSLALQMNNLYLDSPVHFVANGHACHGLMYKGKRPTHIIDFIEDREGERFEKWFEHCIKPMIKHAEYSRKEFSSYV